MKKIYLGFILLFTACNFEEVNRDPVNTVLEDVTSEQILPGLQIDLARTLADNVARLSGNMVNQIIYRQGKTSLNEYNYAAADAINEGTWSDLFVNCMNVSKILIEKPESNNSHKGIARILLAVALGTTTSTWGDIPYFNAFRPGVNFSPDFSDQQELYEEIQNQLDQAILELERGDPVENDMIFSGDLSKWLKTAYALKARYYLHLIKVNPESYQSASEALENAMTSNEDNCIFQFIDGKDGEINPLFLEKGSQNTQVDPEFAELLINYEDPRTRFYTIARGSIFGGFVARYGAYYTRKGSPFPIITYEECEFMRAEIALQNNQPEVSEQHLYNGMEASMQRITSEPVGSEEDEDLALPSDSAVQANLEAYGNFDGLSEEQRWARLFEQRHIALFLQAECWSDYRRSATYTSNEGLPNLESRTDQPIPRRLMYPANEITRNQSAPSPTENPTLYERFWWDVVE